jgi:hypothetical protein
VLALKLPKAKAGTPRQISPRMGGGDGSQPQQTQPTQAQQPARQGGATPQSS